MEKFDENLRQFAGYSMKRAMSVIQTDVNAALTPFELRMVTFSALVVIADNPGLKQAQLADALSIERPNLVLVVDELERRDLILRDRDPADRRAYALQVTLAGRRLGDRAMAAVQDHEKRMTAGLTEDQRQALIAALRQIEENGKADDDSGKVSRA